MSKSPTDSLGLAERNGLPEALRVLADEFPREIWEQHSNFDGLTRFWLDRHIMFRRLLALMQDDNVAMVDRKLDQSTYANRLARYGGMFVEQLHGHHQIEDAHYFPKLVGLDSRLERGFELLDSDHHELDSHLGGFAEAANTVLQARGDDTMEAAKAFGALLQKTDRFLNRHLQDEEDLIVPVILKHGADGLV